MNRPNRPADLRLDEATLYRTHAREVTPLLPPPPVDLALRAELAVTLAPFHDTQESLDAAVADLGARWEASQRDIFAQAAARRATYQQSFLGLGILAPLWRQRPRGDRVLPPMEHTIVEACRRDPEVRRNWERLMRETAEEIGVEWEDISEDEVFVFTAGGGDEEEQTLLGKGSPTPSLLVDGQTLAEEVYVGCGIVDKVFDGVLWCKKKFWQGIDWLVSWIVKGLEWMIREDLRQGQWVRGGTDVERDGDPDREIE